MVGHARVLKVLLQTVKSRVVFVYATIYTSSTLTGLSFDISTKRKADGLPLEA